MHAYGLRIEDARFLSDIYKRFYTCHFFTFLTFLAHIPLHCHPNIGGDIPIDVPTNQNIGGDTSPASPAGLTPMRIAAENMYFGCQ